ncbi:TonB-dependent receptor [Sphingosinicella sp. BN140058]|uniref:TonB-dependent receptor n=1 Tax=Sphingosinicella sp. BN140058 TaxID=1892855 RepID=UPI0010124D5F|nr:TonB-dependent receptor [Sphingosinicella sp. BN140058]QAY78740.1 TonB-dependent receptor [Sphingosinicella sp. BN140058]
MRTTRSFTSALLYGIAPLAATAPAAAQQAAVPESPQTEGADTAGIADTSADQDEIVIVGTAGAGTRRQDAAFAVTTLSNAAIEQAAPNSTADLLRTVPGVSAESSGGQNGANIFVRGYPSGGDAQFVTFQLNGVPIFPPPTLSFLENSQLVRLDETVQRVEAVRGGTGSLFSSGQPGLTVNVVQREGSDTLHGLGKISYTDYDELRGDAFISGPINDDTYFMVGGFYARGHGLRDPGFRAEDGGQLTANLRHDFGNRGSVLIYARYLNDHGQWLLPIPIIQNGDDISEYPGFDAGTGALAGPDTRITTNNVGRTLDLAEGRGANVGNIGVTFDYELVDNLRLRERMSWLGGSADTVGLVPVDPPSSAAAMAVTLGGPGATVGSLSFASGGGSTLPAGQQVMRAGAWEVRKEIQSFVNDLALELKTGGNILTAGFYYADFDTRDRWALGNQMLLTAEENARRLNLVLGDGRLATRDGFTSGATFAVNAYYTGTDYAFYAVDEFQITDQLRIDAGARWQRHVVDGRIENLTTNVDTDGNPATLFNNGTSVLNGSFRTVDFSKSRWSWTAGANFDFTDRIGVFARYSKGRSFPQFDNLRDNLTITATVDTYEAGLKLSMPWLNLYATLFHNKFRGLASTQIIGNQLVESIGGAKANGVELEGVVRPFPGFSLSASGTWLDATYQDFFTAGGTIDNSGNRVQRQPRWRWRVTPSYEVDLGSIKPALFATLEYLGDRFSDPQNQQLLPHFYQLDAGVSVDLNDRLRLQVTGNNLTNEIGLTEGNPRLIGSQGSGPILARPILGRSFRFSVAYEF